MCCSEIRRVNKKKKEDISASQTLWVLTSPTGREHIVNGGWSYAEQTFEKSVKEQGRGRERVPAAAGAAGGPGTGSSLPPGHATSTRLYPEEATDTMAAFRRRTRPKLLALLLLGGTLVGYLILSRPDSGEVGDTMRRGAPVVEGQEKETRVLVGELLGDEELKKPVYEKPPLDMDAPGEMGRAVKLNLDEEEKRQEEESLKNHQINIYISDKVSLHRRLPEIWNPL